MVPILVMVAIMGFGNVRKIGDPHNNTKGEGKMGNKTDRYANYQIEYKKNSGTLHIVIDLDESRIDVQPSKSGNSMVIATTGGAVQVPGTPYRLNLNLYRKA